MIKTAERRLPGEILERIYSRFVVGYLRKMISDKKSSMSDEARRIHKLLKKRIHGGIVEYSSTIIEVSDSIRRYVEAYGRLTLRCEILGKNEMNYLLRQILQYNSDIYVYSKTGECPAKESPYSDPILVQYMQMTFDRRGPCQPGIHLCKNHNVTVYDGVVDEWEFIPCNCQYGCVQQSHPYMNHCTPDLRAYETL